MSTPTYMLSLDLNSTAFQGTCTLRHGDTNRLIKVSLREDGKHYRIPSNTTVTFKMKKPDGKFLYNECSIIDDTIHYEVTKQTTAFSGIAEAEFQLINANSEVFATPKIYISIEKNSILDTEIESTNEFNALVRAMNAANIMDIDIIQQENGDALITITRKDGSNKEAEILRSRVHSITEDRGFVTIKWINDDGSYSDYVMPSEAYFNSLAKGLKQVAYTGSYSDLINRPKILKHHSDGSWSEMELDEYVEELNSDIGAVGRRLSDKANELEDSITKAYNDAKNHTDAKLANLTGEAIKMFDGPSDSIYEHVQSVTNALSTRITNNLNSVNGLASRVKSLEDTPHVDTNTTYTFQKIQFGGVDNLLITPSEGSPTRIPIPAGMTRSEVNGAIESATTDIKEDLSLLKNSDKSTTSGKVWMTTETGAEWADAPQGGGTVDAYTKIESDGRYQTKGDYALSSDIPSDDHISELIENALGTSVDLTRAILEVL